MNIGDKVVVTTDKWDGLSFGPQPGDTGKIIPPDHNTMPGETLVSFENGQAYYFEDDEIEPAPVEPATYAGLADRLDELADYAERLSGFTSTVEELRQAAHVYRVMGIIEQMGGKK